MEAESSYGVGNAAGSLASSVGTIFEIQREKKRSYAVAYNQALQSYTESNRISLQNKFNSHVAGVNLAELDKASSQVVSNALYDNARIQKDAKYKSQAGSGGDFAMLGNLGGTRNLLAAGLQEAELQARREAELTKLAQGFQLPLVGLNYSPPDLWPYLIQALNGGVTSFSKATTLTNSDEQIWNEPNSPQYLNTADKDGN